MRWWNQLPSSRNWCRPMSANPSRDLGSPSLACKCPHHGDDRYLQGRSQLLSSCPSLRSNSPSVYLRGHRRPEDSRLWCQSRPSSGRRRTRRAYNNCYETCSNKIMTAHQIQSDCVYYCAALNMPLILRDLLLANESVIVFLLHMDDELPVSINSRLGGGLYLLNIDFPLEL